MNKFLLMDIIQGNNIVLPMFLLSKYKELKLELNEFIFLMYLHGFGNNSLFNPAKYAEELNIDLNDVMELIGNLSEKSFININILKNDKGVMEEVVNLDDFYKKIEIMIIGNASDNKEKC